MWLVPPGKITLDIETIGGKPSDAEEALRREFAPPARWRPITIGQNYLQALAAKKERLALLDTAPIITVALCTEADLRLLHWLPLEEANICGAPLERLPSERLMLLRLRDYLQMASSETVLIGHNIRHFDLPRLRLRMLFYGLRLPPCLARLEQPTYDTMLMWKYFSTSEKTYISLRECLELAGLEHHKTFISGAAIPELYRNKDFRTIAAYAVADVMAQDALYLWMTGQVSSDRVGPEATGGHEATAEAAAAEIAAGPAGTTPTVAEMEVEKILQELEEQK